MCDVLKQARVDKSQESDTVNSDALRLSRGHETTLVSGIVADQSESLDLPHTSNSTSVDSKNYIRV
jgi:hypothetical protein